MRKKWYEYLISYNFSKEGYLTPCSGTSAVSRLHKIDSIAEVQSVTKLLESSIDGATNFAITNIMYLGRNRHE